MPRLVSWGVVATLFILLAGAEPAAAHASLIGTDPPDGAMVTAAPRKVRISFNEGVSQVAVAVTAPDGATVATSDVHAVDNDVLARVAASDERGRYTIAYRVVSADGHPVSGTVTFTTTTGRTVDQVTTPRSQSFVHRHRAHLIWGLAAAVVAVGLILAPLRRNRDA